MTKLGKTDITIVLDRSGSMGIIKQDTIGGFNEFVEDQKKVEGECCLTLVQFDTQDPYEVVRDAVAIAEVKPLDGDTYQPRAGTPLYDAIGRAVVNAGVRLGKMAEEERPEHVIFAIITDGEENSSVEYPREKVLAMIKEQTDTWDWKFVFLGANQDAFAESAKIGIATAGAMEFTSSAVGVKTSHKALSSNVAMLRCGKRSSMDWTDEQRAEQKEAAK